MAVTVVHMCDRHARPVVNRLAETHGFVLSHEHTDGRVMQSSLRTDPTLLNAVLTACAKQWESERVKADTVLREMRQATPSNVERFFDVMTFD